MQEINVQNTEHLLDGGFSYIFKGEYYVNTVILKTSKYSEDIPDDIFKEIMISKSCNSPYIINFLGYCYFENRFYIVSEFYPYSLYDALKLEDILKVFKKIFIAVSELNDAGISHLDLKPENVMFTSRLEVKLIDLGISCYSGLLRKNVQVITTYGIQPPENNLINASFDCYSISCFFLGFVLPHRQEKFLSLKVSKNNFFVYKRCKEGFIQLQNLKKEEIEDMNGISIYLLPFFTHCFNRYNERFTCKDCLLYPLFSHNTHEDISFFVSDINPTIFENDIYPFHEIKQTYIFEHYRTAVLPINNTAITELPFSQEEYLDNFDAILNTLLFCCSFDRNVYELFKVMNKSMFSKNLSNFRDKINIISSNFRYIPFQSLIISYVCNLRYYGEEEQKISYFHNNCYTALTKVIISVRPKEISFGEFFDNFFNLQNCQEFLKRILN